MSRRRGKRGAGGSTRGGGGGSPARRAELDRLQKRRAAEAQQAQVAMTQIESYEESYSGFLPHPAHIEQFERLHPGAAGIIFNSFDQQGQHRRALELMVVKGSEARHGRGQWMALGIMLAAIVSGTVIALEVNAVAGAGVDTAALGTGGLIWILGGRPPKG